MIAVRVKPGSKQPGLTYEADTWVLRVRERAVEGAANDACVHAIAEALNVAPSNVELTRGIRARLKTFSVRGLTATEVAARLERYCERRASPAR